MNTPDSPDPIFPADPRLTAYAFGELEGGELTLSEAAVADLRGFGGHLATGLGDEPLAATVVDAPIRPAKNRPRRVLRFPLHYLAMAAAACFAVVVWLRQGPGGLSPLAMNSPEKKENAFVLSGNAREALDVSAQVTAVDASEARPPPLAAAAVAPSPLQRASASKQLVGMSLSEVFAEGGRVQLPRRASVHRQRAASAP